MAMICYNQACEHYRPFANLPRHAPVVEVFIAGWPTYTVVQVKRFLWKDPDGSSIYLCEDCHYELCKQNQGVRNEMVHRGRVERDTGQDHAFDAARFFPLG